MEGLARRLDEKVVSLPGIVRRRSRWGGPEAYYVGSREIGHYHNADEIDVRVTKEYAKQFKSDSRAILRKRSSDWVAIGFRNEADLEFVVEAMKLAMAANRI